MKEVELKSLCLEPFQKIGKEWMLISAGSPERCSTMTASWGGLGVLWGSDVSFVFVRPQRHTLSFLQANDHYSLSFFKETYRQALNYCGSHSGGENQKIAAAGLTLLPEGKEAPLFAQASLTLVCRKLYCQRMRADCFTVPEVAKKWYPDADYHDLFVGEIEKALLP